MLGSSSAPCGLSLPSIARQLRFRSFVNVYAGSLPGREAPFANNARLADVQARASRRTVLIGSSLVFVTPQLMAGNAEASKLGPGLDKAWEAMGGGPADLVFPQQFSGLWNVESTLVSLETPLGPEFVPDNRVVNRALTQDLNKPIRYQMRFISNGTGQVVPDRRFNTSSLMSYYMGGGSDAYTSSIRWAVDDPNTLRLELPDGMSVMTRVTRRSEDAPQSNRIETSEYFEQVFDMPGRPEPKVKASQCFTKYLFRDASAAGQGPVIVATQVVSDYLTPYDDAALLLQARGRPVVVYTYKCVQQK